MRLTTIRYILSFLLLVSAITVLACASVLSPVAPVVTADDCQKLTTCEQCISNTACGYCGNSCMAATSADARDTAPKTCSGSWVWKVGTCPDPTAAKSSSTPAAPAEPPKP